MARKSCAMAALKTGSVGARLKRALLMCRHHSVAPKAAFPIPSQKQLASRTVLAVQSGEWKKYSYSEWQRMCVLTGDLVSNELSDGDQGYLPP